jgi:signal transduction histidine kinase
MPTAGSLVRATVGLGFGAALAFVELAFLVVGVPALPFARSRVHAVACRLADVNRTRLRRFLGDEHGDDYTGDRALRYLAVRCVVGMLAFGIFVLILLGAGSGVIILFQVVTGQPVGGGDPEGADWWDIGPITVLAVLLVFLAVQGLVGVASLERRAAHHFLGPSQQELLRRRVSELATSRAGVVAAVNDERRRIERDLHDGVQQRLVALGMLLGRARRTSDQDHADDLLRQAHEESQRALVDLREVTWRVYPTALDDGGLGPALEAVAERSAVPVRLRYGLVERLDEATETVAYFVVSEAVTNALKHGNVSSIGIDVLRDDGGLAVSVTDDGVGGAQPAGTGLSGLARRVAAADGEFTVDSPAGGPTVVRAWLPCG